MKQRVHESRHCGSSTPNTQRWKTAADERGSAAIELVLLVPALMLLLMFVVAGGRVARQFDLQDQSWPRDVLTPQLIEIKRQILSEMEGETP